MPGREQLSGGSIIVAQQTVEQPHCRANGFKMDRGFEHYGRSARFGRQMSSCIGT